MGARDTCRDVSSLVTKSGTSGKSGTQIKAGSTYQQAALLGITAVPFIHKYPVFQLRRFWTGRCKLLESHVKVCVSCLSGAACARPFCVVFVGCVCMPLDVRDSMCTSVFETASTALLCVQGRGQTIGKHLGSLVDPSGSCSAQPATRPGSL